MRGLGHNAIDHASAQSPVHREIRDELQRARSRLQDVRGPCVRALRHLPDALRPVPAARSGPAAELREGRRHAAVAERVARAAADFHA